MTLLLVWTLAFWVVNEAADALSFSNDYIGNHAELFDYTQDRQVIRPMSFTTVKQFLSSANVVDPEGRTNTSVLQVTYGPGYFGQSTALGIAGWYSAPGYPYWNVTRMTLEYEVFFPTGFIFVKEGKLPGIWGADGISSTTFDCGGGSVNRSNPNCFSTRLMWRNATGAGAACCDPSYGDIVGRNFALLTGQWQKLAVMVDLQDGLTQVIHNGKVVISYIVKYGSIRLFNGIKFDTFFGGGSSSFSSPTTQYSYFRNFKLFVASTSRSYGQVKRSTSKTANSPAKTSRKSLASAQTSKKKTLGPVKTSMKKAMGTAKTSKKRTVIANGPKSTSKKRAATVKAPAKSSNNIHQAPPVASTRKRSHVVVRSRSTAPARMPMTSKTESANPLAVGSNSGHQNFPSATSYVFVLLGLAIIYVF